MWSKIGSGCHVMWKHIYLFMGVAMYLLLDLLLKVREEHPLPCILAIVPLSILAGRGQLISVFLDYMMADDQILWQKM